MSIPTPHISAAKGQIAKTVLMLIALVGTLVGCLIGFLVGIVQTIPVSKKDSWLKRTFLWLVRLILNIYVEVFRGTPMVLMKPPFSSWSFLASSRE